MATIIDNTSPIRKDGSDLQVTALLQDLQGNILKSHAKPFVRLLFLRFAGDPAAVRTWIRTSVAVLVTPMTAQLADHAAQKSERVVPGFLFCSFSLSKSGFDYLELAHPPDDASFVAGMDGGTISNDPAIADWEPGYRDAIQAVIILGNDDQARLEAASAALKASMSGIATVAAEERGQGIPGEKEHFGFADGRSQPRFFDEDMQDEGPTAVWNPFASLSLVLKRDPNGKAFSGGLTGTGDEPAAELTGDHGYGSYLVFRKLEQDVVGWNVAVDKLAGSLNVDPALAGAFAVGRFKDGTPVTMHGTATGEMPIANDFDYSADMNGAKCPFHAHIRKANPRGDTARQFQVSLESEKARRIARRGIPYEGTETRGLLFMCYQANIVEQFDFIQNHWVDDPGFLHEGTGVDAVIGQGAASKVSWPSSHGGTPHPERLPFGQFVTMRGGQYFFTPAISSLSTI